MQQRKILAVLPPGGSAASLIFVSAVCLGLAACGPSYSPNTYSTVAVQQANKVDQAVVVGVRQIDISADTTVGALAGGGAGGIAGTAAADGFGIGQALGALGGSVIGGIVGSTVEHQTNDTNGYEYIVRKTNGDLMSVTQKDTTPLAIGTHVLIIDGKQARIVPDYTVAVGADKPTAKNEKDGKSAPAAEAKQAEQKQAEQKQAEEKPAAPVAADQPAAPVAADQPAAPVAAEKPPAPVAEQKQPATPEAQAAPASAHVAITETPLSAEPAPTAGDAAPAPAAAPMPSQSDQAKND